MRFWGGSNPYLTWANGKAPSMVGTIAKRSGEGKGPLPQMLQLADAFSAQQRLPRDRVVVFYPRKRVLTVRKRITDMRRDEVWRRKYHGLVICPTRHLGGRNIVAFRIQDVKDGKTPARPSFVVAADAGKIIWRSKGVKDSEAQAARRRAPRHQSNTRGLGRSPSAAAARSGFVLRAASGGRGTEEGEVAAGDPQPSGSDGGGGD